MNIHAGGRKRAEVVGGLLSRQAAFAASLAANPMMWSTDVSYVLLRCMAETHIALAWLVKFGKPEHFEQFIEYGLGQEKLLLEHLKERMPDQAELLEKMEDRINQERYTALLPVNLGQFMPKSTLQMAEDCDCLEIFFLKFQPFSSSVHGTWNALRKANLVSCANPLHGYHLRPVFGHWLLDPHSGEQAVRLMSETFDAWCMGLGLSRMKLEACQAYLRALSDEPDQTG